MEIKLIIFDLDGTLVDAYPAITASLNYTLKKLGLMPQDPLVIRRAVGRGDENLLRPFVKKGDLKRALIIYRRHHRGALLRRSHLLPKAREVLRYLKSRKYLLAVASNRPSEFSLILLRHLGIAKYFGQILCADKISRRKPHPEILNRIRKRFKLSFDEAVYVGDMCIDVKTAQRAKVRAIAVATGSNTQEELRRCAPDRLIRNIAQLKKLF